MGNGRVSIVYGNNSGNRITGGSDFDWIYGRGGDDVITGRAGGDMLLGEAGNDTLKGEAGDDFLWGSAGTFAGAGNDVIDGGTGVDTVYYSNQGAVRGVTADLGTGTVRSAAGSDRLISVENFWGSERADIVSGSARGEIIWGDGGNDRIDGRAGDDWLWGDAGNDTLAGGTGNDSLFSGSGTDQLTGGAGADQFVFGNGDSLSGAGRDVILDFRTGDTINVGAVDAKIVTAVDDVFRFIGSGAFTDAGQLRAIGADSGMLVQGNTDADATAEFEVFVAGVSKLSTHDFFV